MKIIVLNNSSIDTSAKEKVALAEELAHFETNSLYYIQCDFNTPTQRLNRRKAELKAKRRAIENIIPPEDIQNAINNWAGNNLYKIAEYCDVPVDYLQDAISYYETKGIYFKWLEESV